MCQAVGTNDRWSLPRHSDGEVVAAMEIKNKDSGFPIKNVGNDPRGERRWIPD